VRAPDCRVRGCCVTLQRLDEMARLTVPHPHDAVLRPHAAISAWYLRDTDKHTDRHTGNAAHAA
jgi:hypothetical protein